MLLVILTFFIIITDALLKYIVLQGFELGVLRTLDGRLLYLTNNIKAETNFGFFSLGNSDALIFISIVVILLITTGAKKQEKTSMYRLGLHLYIAGLLASITDILVNGGSTGIIALKFTQNIQPLYLGLSTIVMGLGVLLLTINRYNLRHDIHSGLISDDEKVRLILNSKNADALRMTVTPTFYRVDHNKAYVDDEEKSESDMVLFN